MKLRMSKGFTARSGKKLLSASRLSSKNSKARGQLGQPSTGLAQLGQPEDQRPQPGAVSVADILEIQHDIDLAGLMQGAQGVAQCQISVPQGERALQVETLTESSASLNQPDYHYNHGDD